MNKYVKLHEHNKKNLNYKLRAVCVYHMCFTLSTIFQLILITNNGSEGYIWHWYIVESAFHYFVLNYLIFETQPQTDVFVHLKFMKHTSS